MDKIYFKWCPKEPNFTIGWDKIENDFDWFKKLKNIKNNSNYNNYNADNIYTHTKAVCEKLVTLKEWQLLDEIDRAVIFYAALMHYITKSPYRRELNARSLIYKNNESTFNFSLEIREKIVKLVRYYDLPLSIMKLSDPQKEILKVNQMIRLDHLSLLTKAYVMSKTNINNKVSLDKIDYFKNLCIENECYDKTFEFKNNFSRFMYFFKDGYLPTFEVSDNTKFEVIMIVGLPLSGKDTFIRKTLKDYQVVSLDLSKEELSYYNKDNFQGKSLQNAKEKAREYMRDRISFVWNSTNINKNFRNQLIKFFTDYGAITKIYYIETSYQELLKRTSENEKHITERQINQYIDKLELPDFTDAHSVLRDEID
ncbi:MAG: ATP-binding protein [Clostridiales bacterium]